MGPCSNYNQIRDFPNKGFLPPPPPKVCENKPPYSSALRVTVRFVALTFFYWIASILFKKQIVGHMTLINQSGIFTPFWREGGGPKIPYSTGMDPKILEDNKSKLFSKTT